jgi:hypothetical protein
MAVPARPQNGSGGASRWDGVSQARRFNDPDYFLDP